MAPKLGDLSDAEKKLIQDINDGKYVTFDLILNHRTVLCARMTVLK